MRLSPVILGFRRVDDWFIRTDQFSFWLGKLFRRSEPTYPGLCLQTLSYHI